MRDKGHAVSAHAGAGEAEREPRLATDIASLRKAAIAAHQSGDLDAALKHYRAYLRLNPGDAALWSNLGALHRKRREFRVAVACHRRAVELDPSMTTPRSNLANALSELGEAEEALQLRLRLADEDPKNPDRFADIALSLRGLWRNDEAVRLIDAAEKQFGYVPRMRLQRAFANLMLGDWKRGFADYEARYDAGDVDMPPDCPWPRWAGEDLAGKHILVFPEQGFGDAILCARFLPMLRERAGKVTLVAKPPLLRLFKALEGVDAVIPGAPRTDRFDFCSPNMSLPNLLGVPNPLPPAQPLHILDDSRARAKAITAPHADRFRIGVVWTGSLTYGANHRRSVTAERFLPLAEVPGVQLFSLYKGPGHDAFVESGMPSLIVDACGSDRDFADSAAVIDEMDLLITTDTAVVHVAASLGKPVWNMLQYEGFWLYGDGDTTPWYPSMTLYRQPANGDWDSVFARVEADLRALLSEVQE